MTFREKDEKDTLIVKMFSNFSLSYNGKLITGKAKSSESQFNYLMELLLHERENGVSKDKLIATLFYNRDLENVNHAIHSVIYNAKKRLEEFGLPPENYIVQQGGVYYFNPKIPVQEDCKEFETFYVRALEEKDVSQKIALLLDAMHLYVGDFLENQVGIAWIAKENWRYRRIFTEVINLLAGLLKETARYDILEDVGLYSSRTQPFSNWETLTMDAYVNSGQYDKAIALYEETVDLYLHEQGIRPSNKMFELLNTLGSQFEHSSGLMEEIQEDLTEKETEGGGYNCSYPVFLGIYQAVNRMSERNGQMAYLMLCTIVDTKGNAMVKGSNLEELSERLGNAIQSTIRRSDIMNKYSKGQYLVLLMNTTIENTQIIQKRINDKFILNRQQIRVKYYVSPVWKQED